MTLRSTVLALLVPALLSTPALAAKPRFGLYATRMVPSDAAARDFAKPGWGGGVDVSWPLPGTQGLISGIGGFELSSLLSMVK